MLAFAGAILWLIEPAHGTAFIAGLVLLGAWLVVNMKAPLIAMISVIIAYILGPASLTLPLWMPVALIVGSVLLLGSRKPLHDLVSRVPVAEVLTAGQFLLLVGVVLPVLYGAPPIPYTQITPFNVWLAVVAVSTLSYVSYLLQRYALPKSGMLLAAALGGLYSSTATTVVLARSAQSGVTGEMTAAIVAATGMMYLRMLVIIALFDLALMRRLIAPFLILAVLAGGISAFFAIRSGSNTTIDTSRENPLRLGTAVLFAVLLIAISVISRFVQAHAGAHGVFALAAVVGVTDIDPFVLSLAQGGAATIGAASAAVAILIASSSNNLLKAVYTLAFSHRRESLVPAGLLAFLAIAGLGLTAMR